MGIVPIVNRLLTTILYLFAFFAVNTGNAGDLEFFEDLITEPVLVLGVDITHLSRPAQFAVCATGLFFFSLLYGYLQELLSVELCSRQLGLFLAMMQFTGYTFLAYILRSFVYNKQQKHCYAKQQKGRDVSGVTIQKVPLVLYLGLSLLRAVDLAMTNLAMQYINYPAKTLMKSSRVVFTMIFGVVIQRKVYKTVDYAIVLAMVLGLGMFMHADAHSSAVFHHMGVVMLTVSLICDGAISNMSETIMSKFGVGQDEVRARLISIIGHASCLNPDCHSPILFFLCFIAQFIFRLYSISLVAISASAAFKGDLYAGLFWMTQPGTYQQYLDGTPLEERSWSVPSKIAVMILFSSMGFFGSSCSAAITKNFGALTMSITSTARKATTLFLSFFLFNNVCTMEHIAGVVVFIAALTTKSMRRRHHSGKSRRRSHKHSDSKKHRRRRHHKNAAAYGEVPISDFNSEPPPAEGLSLRHRTNSHDSIEDMNSGVPPSRSMVHVV